jgi:hypothetical protein
MLQLLLRSNTAQINAIFYSEKDDIISFSVSSERAKESSNINKNYDDDDDDNCADAFWTV